jgi:hypothetical protein
VAAGGETIGGGRVDAGCPGAVRTGETVAILSCPFALSGNSTRLVTPPSDNST